MRYGQALRDEIAAEGTTPLIGVHDMYSASIAAGHYDGFFVSGFGFAASYYGLPDIGFIAWPDMAAFVERLRGAFPVTICWWTSTTAMSTPKWPAMWCGAWSAAARAG